MDQGRRSPSSPGAASKADSPDEIRRRKEVAARNYEKRHQKLMKEHEERQKKTAEERSRINRELKEKEARELKKQQETLQKRMQQLQLNKKREEEVLARNHAASSRTAAKKNFAFGSSTPRELSYLDQLPKDQKAYDKKLVPIDDPRDASMNESMSAARPSRRSAGGSSLMSTSMYVPSSSPRPPRLPSTPKMTPSRASVAPRTPASAMTQSVHLSLTVSAPRRATPSSRTMSSTLTPIPSRVRSSGPSKMTATAPNTPSTQSRPPRLSLAPTTTSRQTAAGKSSPTAGAKPPSIARRSIPPAPPASRNNQKPASNVSSTSKAAPAPVTIPIRRTSVAPAEVSEREDTAVATIVEAEAVAPVSVTDDRSPDVEESSATDTPPEVQTETTTVSTPEPVVVEEEVLPVHSVAVEDVLDEAKGAKEDNAPEMVASLADELQSLEVQPRAISEADLVGGLSEEEYSGGSSENIPVDGSDVEQEAANCETTSEQDHVKTTEESSDVEVPTSVAPLIDFIQTEPIVTEKIETDAGRSAASSAALAPTSGLENELFALPGAVSVPTTIASANVGSANDLPVSTEKSNIEIVNSLADEIMDAVSAEVVAGDDKSPTLADDSTALRDSSVNNGSVNSLNSTSSTSSSHPDSRAASAIGTEQASEKPERIPGSSQPSSKPPTPPLVFSSVDREAIQKRAEEDKKKSEEIRARLAAVMARTRGGRTSPPSTTTPPATVTPSSTPANESAAASVTAVTPTSDTPAPTVGLSASTAALLQRLKAKGQVGNGVSRILDRHTSDPKLDMAPDDPVSTADETTQQ